MTIMGTNCHCHMHYSLLDLKEHHSHELSEFCQDSKLSICIVISVCSFSACKQCTARKEIFEQDVFHEAK